jgi:murein DD-endopeptidase MepM/ murein hydrolase activator NlpD
VLAVPTPGRVSSPFGYRWGFSDYHSAIDFAGPIGTPVYATAAGTVVNVWPNGSLDKYGNTVVIKHDASVAEAPYSLYAHLSVVGVKKGDRVYRGQRLASIGNTAASKTDSSRTAPPHLHFELLTTWPPAGRDKDRIDPAPLLNIEVPSAKTGFGLGTVALLGGLLWWLRRRRPV